MNTRFAAAIKAQVEAAPMTHGTVPILPGRLLLADGDGLCYYCAGNDETEPGEARHRLIEKLTNAATACGAETVKIVTTARGSHKGHRYAVARVKPYQGQRTSGRRPKNWEYLRSLLEEGSVGRFEVELTPSAEADDLFSRYALNHPDCVIYTQDKDMRMVPGLHLDWVTHLTFRLPANTWEARHGDKVWGRKWFWLQMLMGDTADNIPGLPRYQQRPSVFKPVGEVTAGTLLEGVETDLGALLTLQSLYRGLYGDRWCVEILEQAVLLWMRNDTDSDPFNVLAPGNPLAALADHADYPAARAEIEARINEATIHASIEDDGSITGTDKPSGRSEEPMCAVSTPVLGEPSSSGSRPLDGKCEVVITPVLQCFAWNHREQLQTVRRPESGRFPEWGLRLLAKTRDQSNRATAPDIQDR